jgi:hypothetical protein
MSAIGFLVTVAIVGPSCATVMYPGPRRSSEKIAVFRPGKNTTVLEIDGVAVEGGSMARYEILPGRHEIVGSAVDNQGHGNITADRLSVCFSAEPGHEYKLRSSFEDDNWRTVLLDVASDYNVRFECWEDVSTRGPGTRANAKASPPPTVDPKVPKPGSGVHLGLGTASGGGGLPVGTRPSGGTETLQAGGALFLSIGTSLTPVWIADTLGIGAGASIGLKYSAMNATNGGVDFVRWPTDLWLQTLLRFSNKAFLTLAAGPHKELGANLSGSGVAAGLQSRFDSPWGWMADAGFYYAATWHTSCAFSLRYTKAHYVVGAGSVDASSVGMGVTFHFDP